MARKSHSAAAETLDEIQSSADHLATWIHDNLRLVIGAIAALLVVSGLISWAASRRGAAEDEASTALFEARSSFMRAMGAGFGAFEAPELANPEAAAQIRDEFSQALAGVSEAYPDTTADFLSRLETGLLLHQDDDAEAALAVYEALADEGSQVDALQGLAIQRAAQVLEDLERWDEAAVRHERAAALEGYPLRHRALADAARSFAAAGQNERAVELYERLETDVPELRLPDAERAQARELRALLASDG